MPRVRTVLAAGVLLALFGTFLYIFMVKGLGAGLGWDEAVLNGQIAEHAPMYQVWQMRAMAALNQILIFMAPGALTLLAFRYAQPQMYAGVSLRRFPPLMGVGVSIVLLIAAMPFVLYSFQLNKMVPIPDSLRLAAEQAEAAIKAILQMPTPIDFIANLILIALLPAIGEELVFRGVIQQQLMRRMSPWAAILITGAVFSFFHFQMDGFLPRWLLGIILGWIFWRSGNFWVPVLLHFFNNAIQVTAWYVQGPDSQLAQMDQNVEISVLAALFSLVLAISLGRYATQNNLI